MGSETPVRNQFGTIIGLQPKEEADQIQATLDASMQAVGAMPEVAPPPTSPTKRPLPPPPSLRIEMIALVVTLVVVGFTFLPRRTAAPPPISIPPTAVAPTRTPRPTVTPTDIIPINPRAVTLSTGFLYGDYDEDARIGAAPEGLACTIAGQSPDGQWAYLECPMPTGKVWAKIVDLGLSAEQRSALMDSRIVSRIVPPVPAFSPPAPQGSGLALAFCADRESIWGKTHQCSSSQAAADALADSEIGAINGTAVAINKQH